MTLFFNDYNDDKAQNTEANDANVVANIVKGAADSPIKPESEVSNGENQLLMRFWAIHVLFDSCKIN